MAVKGGQHKLVRMVALGESYKNMRQIETGKNNCL